MKKRNTSNNPLFKEIRELEQKALAVGILKQSDIKTSEAMREEAWKVSSFLNRECFSSRHSYCIIFPMIKDIQKQGGAQ